MTNRTNKSDELAGHTAGPIISVCRHCAANYRATEWQLAKRDFECAPCRRIRQAEYRAKRKASGNPVRPGRMPLEYEREYSKAYYSNSENRQRRNARMRSYSKDPTTLEKRKARWQVSRAIASGRLTRQSCQVCGDTKTEAHHDDYSKPLDVRWLCIQHHHEHHSRATGEA
jgi:hypothetical protein